MNSEQQNNSINILEKTVIGNADDIIDNIIKTNKVRRFASELNHTQNSDTKRAADIKKIMDLLGASEKKHEDMKKSKLTEIYDKINTQTLHWKWSKLSIPQQKDRVKEYLKITVLDPKKKEEAEKLIFGLINSEKLKKNAITYDTEKSQVTGIFIKEYQDIIQNSDSDSESESASSSESE